MSRHIDGISHISRGHEIYQTNTEQNKVILTRNHGILYAFLLENGRICKVAREEKQAYPIGTILIGKVVNILKNYSVSKKFDSRKQILKLKLYKVSPTIFFILIKLKNKFN